MNGRIVAAIEEERINSKKHSSEFPINAINECLKIGNISFKDVNDISINSDPSKTYTLNFFIFLKVLN